MGRSNSKNQKKVQDMLNEGERIGVASIIECERTERQELERITRPVPMNDQGKTGIYRFGFNKLGLDVKHLPERQRD